LLKFRRFLLAFLLIVTVPPAFAGGPSVLFDPATQEVIAQDRAGEPWYPASLTKLMTAYVVFQRLRTGQLKLDQKIPVSVLANAQPPSKIGVPVGQKVRVDFALQALLVYSANDMAYVLAEAASGNVSAFAAEMNAQARKLGMTGSHFVNPNGLFDPRNISTARDIAILASAILREYPEHNHYFSQDTLRVGKRRLANRNSLLRQMPEADGMKTGFVCSSGFNLVATATRDGRRLGAVIMGAKSGKHRADLAEMLLVDGFLRPRASGSKLEAIPNVETGGIVPADMTKQVCKWKPVTVARAKELGGWGISFGNYESAATADMALRGRMLSRSGIALAEAASELACARYQGEKAPCTVLPPDILAGLAALAPDGKDAAPAAGDPQGDDVETPKKRKPRKAKKN
jgi:D-alanyl-D-alanine carboxypeptidase